LAAPLDAKTYLSSNDLMRFILYLRRVIESHFLLPIQEAQREYNVNIGKLFPV